jgi:hypothetical protein
MINRLSIMLVAAFTASLALAEEETAPYKVLRTIGDVEIRQYESLTLVGAESSAPGSRDNNGAFMKLFRYISGNNDANQKIAMTTPVFKKRDSAEAPMKMYFVLPEKHKNDAPEPKSESVDLLKQPETIVAAIRFPGRMNQDMYKTKTAAMQTWLTESGTKATGELWAAQYDSPWVPGPNRRNEILVPIDPKTLPKAVQTQ